MSNSALNKLFSGKQNNESRNRFRKTLNLGIFSVLIYTIIIVLITIIVITKLNPYYKYKCTIEKTQTIDLIIS